MGDRQELVLAYSWIYFYFIFYTGNLHTARASYIHTPVHIAQSSHPQQNRIIEQNNRKGNKQ